jgi:hypothetical protein
MCISCLQAVGFAVFAAGAPLYKKGLMPYDIRAVSAVCLFFMLHLMFASCVCLQAVGFAVFAAGALLYDKGHKQEEEASTAAGQTPNFSKWAVLKSTLNIHTGHFVGLRTFRAAANSVMAAQRLARLAEEGEGDTVSG